MSETDTIQPLDLSIIQPNPHQPRKHINPEELQDLVDSIKIHGVLEPIVVAHTPAGYQIIAGERRWRAAKLAGLATVPAIVKKTSPRGMLEMSIVENVQRSDLNCLERAHALNRLFTEFNLNHAEIAKRISKSNSYVSNSMRLLDLPDALKDGLLGNLISEGHARALQAITDTKKLIDAYKQVLRENASVRRTEEIARRLKSDIPEADRPLSHTPPVLVSKEIDHWEAKLKQSLGDNAEVRLRRSFRQTVVVISLKGSLKDTQPQLERIYAITKDQSATDR
jgi:ParB family transcriptional regulator, chromosome partitioning protein